MVEKKKKKKKKKKMKKKKKKKQLSGSWETFDAYTATANLSNTLAFGRKEYNGDWSPPRVQIIVYKSNFFRMISY